MSSRPSLSSGLPISVTMSGGGTRLYGHAGVLLAVEDAGLVIKEVMGVSGGALVAAGYAALGAQKTAALLETFDVKTVLKLGWLLNYGYYNNEAIVDFCNANGITWEAVQARGVELKIGVTALEPGVQIVWTPASHPAGMTLGEAIRISSSIPGVWGYTRMATSLLVIPDKLPGEVLPTEVTLVDGGCSDMMLPGDDYPWIASNISFTGYRSTEISGVIDYAAQILASLQYRAVESVCEGASVVVRHLTMQSTGWLDVFTPAQITSIIAVARTETAAAIAAARSAA